MARVIGTPNGINASNRQRKAMTFTKRKCLPCGEMFDSWGPGNRICKQCKSTDMYKSYQRTTSIKF